VTKKRKGFKKSPSVTKMQAAALARENRDLHREVTLCQQELSRREARILQTLEKMRELVHFLDVSRFGGHRTYRCLTPLEEIRLHQIRVLEGL
jgi:hypothetical protein